MANRLFLSLHLRGCLLQILDVALSVPAGLRQLPELREDTPRKRAHSVPVPRVRCKEANRRPPIRGVAHGAVVPAHELLADPVRQRIGRLPQPPPRLRVEREVHGCKPCLPRVEKLRVDEPEVLCAPP